MAKAKNAKAKKARTAKKRTVKTLAPKPARSRMVKGGRRMISIPF